MPTPNKSITDREKAAIILKEEGYIKTWREAYIIADERPTKDVKLIASLQTLANRWSASPKVQKFLNDYKTKKEIELYKRINEAGEGDEGDRKEVRENGSLRNRKQVKGLRNFLDHSSQMEKLNELVNEAKDSKDALDALRVPAIPPSFSPFLRFSGGLIAGCYLVYDIRHNKSQEEKRTYADSHNNYNEVHFDRFYKVNK